MNTTQRNFVGLMALALLIAMTPISQANATVRVRATVKTPHLTVRVNPSPVAYRHGHASRHLVQRKAFKVSKHDRKVAKRLARYTGYAKGEMLEMLRAGYSWHDIGRYLNLRPQVVRAAQSGKSWNRFLNGYRDRDHRVVCCDHH